MKLLQTIGGFTALGGGTSTCTYQLLSAIHKVDSQAVVDILTPEANNTADPLMGKGEEWIKTVPYDYRTPLALSRNMTDWLQASDYKLYHTNGLWMHINHITCSEARKKGRPYVITPHGMLYPETLARSAWKKWPLRKLWFDKDIRMASCIHATCKAEMRHLRNLGYRGPVAQIGNPVEVPAYTAEMIAARVSIDMQKGLKIGFLGRIHPRKNVDHIIQAVALRKDLNIEAFVIGKGDADYEQYLRQEAQRLGVDDRIKWLGFLNGKEKFAQLAQLDALFVPSDMENFGMIIPEALIVGTPVMASLGTPWEALNRENFGWWTDNPPETLANVIDKIAALSPEEHKAMGQRGRDYILRTFASEKVASQMLELYRWLLGEGSKPEFVYL